MDGSRQMQCGSKRIHCIKQVAEGVGVPSSSRPGQAQEHNEKEKKIRACQTSIAAHPAQAPEGKTLGDRDRDHHSPLYRDRRTRTISAILADRARDKK